MCCDNEGNHRCGGFLPWIASWIVFPWVPLLSVVLALISFARSRESGTALVRSTLFSPLLAVPLFFVVQATVHYSQGRAALNRSAMRTVERNHVDAIWNVDMETRLPVRTAARSSCRPFPCNRFYNYALTSLVRHFGPQPGTWTGTLPRLEEAVAALENGVAVKGTDLRNFPEYRWMWTTSVGAPKDFRRQGCQVSTQYEQKESPTLRRGQLASGLLVFGTGRDFVTLVDPATRREVARHGMYTPPEAWFQSPPH